jgi:hypothetical protein
MEHKRLNRNNTIYCWHILEEYLTELLRRDASVDVEVNYVLSLIEMNTNSAADIQRLNSQGSVLLL